MSSNDDQDEASKTEDPTPKRMREAREKGNVASSKEVSHWFMIAAFGLFMLVFVASMAGRIAESMRAFISSSHQIATDPGALQDLLVRVGSDLLFFLGIPLAMAFVAALAGGLVQNGLIFTAEPITPKLDKINPISGVKRIVSLRSLTEFAKSVFKFVLIGGAIAIVFYPFLDDIDKYVNADIKVLLNDMHAASLKVIMVVLALISIIALADFLYQRWEHHRKLKMTKQEVKDEFKQTEGDPHIKAKLRQLRMERARRRMMTAVPGSDVVVTNPTHFAVALKYDEATMTAPMLVAKGVDLVAKRIRELAEENEVPIVENPPLARALHAGVDLDQEVPPDYYQAVAEIIGYVMRLKRGLAQEPYRPSVPVEEPTP